MKIKNYILKIISYVRARFYIKLPTKENVRKYCKPIYILLWTEYSVHRRLKTACGFFYGFFLGVLLWVCILANLGFSPLGCLILGLTICFTLGFGNAFSIQIRCVSLLAYPNFCGKSGRAVLKTLVLAYVIAGPIQNLTTNAKEIVRVFTCSSALTYNMTKTRFDLMTKPFHDAIMGAKADISEVKETLRSFRDVSLPIKEEIEGEGETFKLVEENDYLDMTQGDSKRSADTDKKLENTTRDEEAKIFENRYQKKLEARCEAQLTRGAEKCRGMFRNAYDKCYDKVSWVAAWILCWPMKLTFVCNIAQAMGGGGSSGGPCDATKEIDPGVGEGYAYMRRSGKRLAGNFKEARMQYEMLKMNRLLDIRSAADTAQAIVYSFKEKRTFFDGLMVFIKRILSFIFLKIILSAQKYHDSYISNIDHDNVYVTHYFKKIDARRHKERKQTLLPLKKAEKLKLLDPWSLNQLKSERVVLFGQTVKLLLEMITATTFILLDRLFYETLDLIKRHAKIEYTQEGHHDISLQVIGTGMIASMLRSVVKGFNVKKRIKTAKSNVECLPNPTEMSTGYVVSIYGTYIMVLVLLAVQAYTQRARRAICGYFYPKREKRRVLHIYNTTLKRRIGLLRHLKRRVRRQAREHKLTQEISVLLGLRMKYPKYCSWLIILPAARRTCVVCRAIEPYREPKFMECPNATCRFVHCQECWHDLGEICLVCTSDDINSDGIEDSECSN